MDTLAANYQSIFQKVVFVHLSPTIKHCCCYSGAMQANAYNVALLNGGMGDGSQLLQVDQSGVMYNNLVPLGKLHHTCTCTCIVPSFISYYAYC